MNLGEVEEEIFVDPYDVNKCFQKNIRGNNKFKYLERLLDRAIDDFELESEERYCTFK